MVVSSRPMPSSAADIIEEEEKEEEEEVKAPTKKRKALTKKEREKKAADAKKVKLDADYVNVEWPIISGAVELYQQDASHGELTVSE